MNGEHISCEDPTGDAFPGRPQSLNERLLHDAYPSFCRSGLSQAVKFSIRRPPSPNKIELNRLITEVDCWSGQERSRDTSTEYHASRNGIARSHRELFDLRGGQWV